MDLDVVFRASRVVTPAGEIACDVGVKDGVIAALGELDGPVVQLADDEVLLPGLVDTHVHVNEPGRTEWEGFASATRAAAAGGVTTILDMPLNSIPATVDVVALEVKRKAADGQCYVDVGFWGGAVPASLGALGQLHDAGVFGFKCFLVDSGVEEFPHLSADQLERAMRELATLGSLLIVHAEDPAGIAVATASTAYADFLASRPRDAEDSAIELVVELSKRTGGRAHIVHVSSAHALPLLAGTGVSAETCPHYLTFTAEEIADGATQFKCCPPIREDSNREALWEGLRAGVIDMVVTDHSPSTVELKRLDTGDFATAWGGIASLQLGLSAVWTEARRRGFSLGQVAHWMSQAPAQLTGMQRKGAIAVGYDADVVVFAPDDAYVVDAGGLHHKNPVTPYDGRTLSGVVRSTWLRGERIDVNAEPRGRFLTRGAA
jgi:allantoinase